MNNCLLIDSPNDTLSETIKCFENKRIYIASNMPQANLRTLQKELTDFGLSVSRKDNPDSNVVINSSKTSKDTILKYKYNIYILLFENSTNEVDIISYLQCCIVNHECEIYFDSSKIDDIEKTINTIMDTPPIKKVLVKDSYEYRSYEKCVGSISNNYDQVVVSDYYLFEASGSICKFNLSNLVKADYDIIRNHIKFNLSKLDIEITTCQLTTPSSPKDRRSKLNSLSNKISSVDYRCEVTCEIFKDYTIGVIVWNEIFADRTTSFDINSLKNVNYIYQTTNADWKYTTIC